MDFLARLQTSLGGAMRSKCDQRQSQLSDEELPTYLVHVDTSLVVSVQSNWIALSGRPTLGMVSDTTAQDGDVAYGNHATCAGAFSTCHGGLSRRPAHALHPQTPR